MRGTSCRSKLEGDKLLGDMCRDTINIVILVKQGPDDYKNNLPKYLNTPVHYYTYLLIANKSSKIFS